MGPTGIIEAFDVWVERSPRVRDAGIGPQVNLLVFDGPPEPFHEHIVPPRPFAIHADRDLVTFQQLREGQARELRPLFRVEDLGLAVFCQRLLDSLNAKACVERDRELPGQDLPAEPIDDGGKIGEAACHGDVRDVHCPDLIGAQNQQIPEQIQVDFVSRFRFRGVRTAVDRHDAHPLHQRGHM